MEHRPPFRTNSTDIALSTLETYDSHQLPLQSDSSTPAVPLSQQPLLHNAENLGVAAPARAYDAAELAALAVSLIALAAAVATVSVDTIAWYLGYVNQITVIGFLLSIMNISMMTILPTLFLRCEALFGRSTIQNYEAITRNQTLGSKTGWQWRLALGLVLALPLGLSALYKRFKDGHATITIGPHDSLYNQNFGMYAPPGLLPLGYNTGNILIYNVTMPFLIASTNQMTYQSPENRTGEVPLPDTWPSAYGFNTLLLDNATSALLDAPPPQWITKVQSNLTDGESWNVSTSVIATIATRNSSVDAHRTENMTSPFWAQFDITFDETTQYQSFADGWYLGIFTNPWGTPIFSNPWCFVSLQYGLEEENFTMWAQKWDLSRRYCSGTWRITRGAMELLDGTCNPDDGLPSLLPNDKPDAVLTWTGRGATLHDTFLEALNEFLAPFEKERNSSVWAWPTMATTVASMYWSRIAASTGPGSPHWSNDLFATINNFTESNLTDGLSYERSPLITSTRPALESDSSVLYVVLVVQPLITAFAVIAGVFMGRITIGRGFGTVSVLAGMDRESADLLEGAGFSGKLDRPVHLAVSAEGTAEGGARVVYRLTTQRPSGGGKMPHARAIG